MRNLILCAIFGTAMAVPSRHDCPPALRIGATYAEQKLACPDLDAQAFDRDDIHRVVFYACRSQRVVIVGSLETGKTVGLMVQIGEIPDVAP